MSQNRTCPLRVDLIYHSLEQACWNLSIIPLPPDPSPQKAAFRSAGRVLWEATSVWLTCRLRMGVPKSGNGKNVSHSWKVFRMYQRSWYTMHCGTSHAQSWFPGRTLIPWTPLQWPPCHVPCRGFLVCLHYCFGGWPWCDVVQEIVRLHSNSLWLLYSHCRTILIYSIYICCTLYTSCWPILVCHVFFADLAFCTANLYLTSSPVERGDPISIAPALAPTVAGFRMSRVLLKVLRGQPPGSHEVCWFCLITPLNYSIL